jgi:hypothetical protein
MSLYEINKLDKAIKKYIIAVSIGFTIGAGVGGYIGMFSGKETGKIICLETLDELLEKDLSRDYKSITYKMIKERIYKK